MRDTNARTICKSGSNSTCFIYRLLSATTGFTEKTRKQEMQNKPNKSNVAIRYIINIPVLYIPPQAPNYNIWTSCAHSSRTSLQNQCDLIPTRWNSSCLHLNKSLHLCICGDNCNTVLTAGWNDFREATISKWSHYLVNCLIVRLICCNCFIVIAARFLIMCTEAEKKKLTKNILWEMFALEQEDIYKIVPHSCL